MQSLTPFEILAYFDPGAGSLLVQALVGGAAGLLVFAKYLWDAVLNLKHDRKSRAKNSADKMLAGAGSPTSQR
jgi:hypothetical protein